MRSVNLTNKGRYDHEMNWEESTIDTKVDDKLLDDDIKHFIKAVMPVIEKTKERYEIKTEQDTEKNGKRDTVKADANREMVENRNPDKEFSMRKEITRAELIPVKKKSIIKMWFEKIINKFKSFKLSLFNRKNRDDSIIDVEYREVDNPTENSNSRNLFINQLGVNGIEKKEDADIDVHTYTKEEIEK